MNRSFQFQQSLGNHAYFEVANLKRRVDALEEQMEQISNNSEKKADTYERRMLNQQLEAEFTKRTLEETSKREQELKKSNTSIVPTIKDMSTNIVTLTKENKVLLKEIKALQDKLAEAEMAKNRADHAKQQAEWAVQVEREKLVKLRPIYTFFNSHFISTKEVEIKNTLLEFQKLLMNK